MTAVTDDDDGSGGSGGGGGGGDDVVVVVVVVVDAYRHYIYEGLNTMRFTLHTLQRPEAVDVSQDWSDVRVTHTTVAEEGWEEEHEGFRERVPPTAGGEGVPLSSSASGASGHWEASGELREAVLAGRVSNTRPHCQVYHN